MIDSNLLLDRPDAVVAALARKGVSSDVVLSARDALIQRRSILSEVEALRAEMNSRSKQVGKLIAAGGPGAAAERESLADLKSRLAEKEAALREAEGKSRSLLLVLPNLPSPDAPEGLDESSNVVLRVEGPPADKYDPAGYRPHWEVAGDLGIFDPERAAKLSGSGFSLLYGDGARLIRALVQFGLDLNRDTYLEVLVPHMVRSEVFEGTGHLPKFAEDAYNTTLDNLWLIPTGEVPLTGMHRGELFDADELPKRYMAYSVCFRRKPACGEGHPGTPAPPRVPQGGACSHLHAGNGSGRVRRPAGGRRAPPPAPGTAVPGCRSRRRRSHVLVRAHLRPGGVLARR